MSIKYSIRILTLLAAALSVGLLYGCNKEKGEETPAASAPAQQTPAAPAAEETQPAAPAAEQMPAEGSQPAETAPTTGAEPASGEGQPATEPKDKGAEQPK